MNSDVVWDGIAGGLIGSIVTAGALVVTIRHDSRGRSTERLDEAVVQAQAAVDMLAYIAIAEGLKSSATRTAMFTALQAVPVVTARARQPEPKLADLVNEASTDLSSALSLASYSQPAQDEIVASAQRASIVLLAWLGNKDDVRKDRYTYDDARRQQAGN